MQFNKHRFLFILLLLIGVSSHSAYAQYKWDFGVIAGPSNYLGDIGGYDQDARPWVADMRLAYTRFNFGGFARKKIRRDFAIKTTVNWIRIAGADSLSIIPGRSGRNLSFRNDIFELSVLPEYYFYQLPDFARLGRRQRVDFRSYFFAGVAFFTNNPKAYYPYGDPTGKWYNLRELRTEGQTKPYPLLNIGIPFGIGMDYTFNRTRRLALEINVRKTFTDYLDDVSTRYAPASAIGSDIGIALANRRPEIKGPRTSLVAAPAQYYPGEVRGNPKRKDYYFTLQTTYSFVIKGKSSFYKSRYNYITKAKRRFKRRNFRTKF
jgi:hypothetical protein